MAESAALKIWRDPPPEMLGRNVLQFLQRLGGPTCLWVSGRDSTRCRMAVTLQHGNEPSGAVAIHRWLTTAREAPPVDMLLVVMNVAAALTEPRFSHRQLPGSRDQNRCYGPFVDDVPGRLAHELIDLIATAKPEALIDIHNTSGMGPSFAIAVHLDQRHDMLTSLFTDRLIITDLRLGALMELSEQSVPTVTVECGGAGDECSHRFALEGLQRYIYSGDLFAGAHPSCPIDILHNPVRMELDATLALVYSEAPVEEADLSLRRDIERFNFGDIAPATMLGWLSDDAWEKIAVVDSAGNNLRDDYMRREQGRLYPAVRLKLFMITSNPAIAKSDCLLYAVRCG